MNEKLNEEMIISFRDGSNSPQCEQNAQNAAKKLVYFCRNIANIDVDIYTVNAQVRESGATRQEHRIMHAFLWGYFSHMDDPK